MCWCLGMAIYCQLVSFEGEDRYKIVTISEPRLTTVEATEARTIISPQKNHFKENLYTSMIKFNKFKKKN
jgi:hypothetical protein